MNIFNILSIILLTSVQFSLVTQSCLILCNPMNRSTPGLPVHHQLPEFTQPHVHRVGDAISSSHLILCHPLLLLPPISHHQSLFQQSTLRMRWPKYWSFSFSISPSNEHPGLILIGSPRSPRDSQESSPTPQFKSINSSVSYKSRHILV